MARAKRMEMSAELRSMIAATAAYRKTRQVPSKRIEWYHTVGVDTEGKPLVVCETNETFRQKRLQLAANRWLARAGFYAKAEPEGFDMATHHDSITSHGGLRPTWQGRA